MAKKVLRKRPKTSLAVQDDALLSGDPTLRDQLLDKAARSGVKWVRANVFYGQTNGGKDLTKLDALVAAAKMRGIQVQATLSGDPNYMNPQGGLSYKNADPKLMGQFAKTVARHERGKVERYSIWNEPNYNGFWQGSQKDPVGAGRGYRQVYRAGYGAIKGVDPGAQVMLGEITSQPNAQTFLQSVLAGKPLKTAGLAYHPYAGEGGWDINSLPALQKTLARYKRQGKLQTAKGTAAPLYLTEFGYQRANFQDENKRQALLAQAYQRAQGAGAREMLYYQMVPTKRDPGAPVVADTYGQTVQQGRAPDTSWKWDTSVDPSQLGSYARSVPRAKVRMKRR